MGKGYFVAKRSLGQSFLKSKKIAERLVSALNLKEGELVLEIGPGKGILTEFLIKYPVRVIAIEIDKRLILFLKEKFKGVENLEIREGDILKYEFPERGLKIIGNIPYSISSPLLFHLFSHWESWQIAVLTLQREFASRLLAKPKSKEYSALTLISEIYAEKRRLFPIPAKFFKPEPNVQSLAIILCRRERPIFLDPDFINFIKISFAHRRKILVNNFIEYLRERGKSLSAPELKDFLKERGFSPNIRPEELSLDEFKEIYDALKRL
ncbi:MAG: 16S rRNA (adenine(1518)-N(6)/adenine(1519)-N(6))-dimethyltransferase RsmA [candidate division WOR-3 bacterium]